MQGSRAVIGKHLQRDFTCRLTRLNKNRAVIQAQGGLQIGLLGSLDIQEGDLRIRQQDEITIDQAKLSIGGGISGLEGFACLDGLKGVQLDKIPAAVALDENFADHYGSPSFRQGLASRNNQTGEQEEEKNALHGNLTGKEGLKIV